LDANKERKLNIKSPPSPPSLKSDSRGLSSEIMDALVRSYHVHQMRLRGLIRKQLQNAPSKVQLLNRFYDTKAALPPGLTIEDEHPDLMKQANDIVEAGNAFFVTRENIIVSVHISQKAALAAIGTRFGTMMKADALGAVDHRFKRYWRLSNEIRRTRLDGKSIGWSMLDENGPMFKAFAVAAGYPKPAVLASHVRAAVGMRNGTVPVTLDGAIELGLTTYP
jgi:hypothetical protein